MSSDPVTCARYFNDRVQKFIQNVLKSEFHPLDVVQAYVYRAEFQHRGSPHIWLFGLMVVLDTEPSQTAL